MSSIGMKLRLIPAGELQMGSPQSEEARSSDEDRHLVRIRKSFFLGKHEVTRGEFRQFVADTGYVTEPEKDREGGYGYNADEKKFEGRKPKYTWRFTGFDQTDEHPVVNITWNDAVEFCKWLSKKESKTYRLPTEAEWEYACRAGTITRYQSGDDAETLATVGNVADGTLKENFSGWAAISARDGYVFTAPVGNFAANTFGLHDMHGNVWEWCSDWYDAKYYANSPKDDPHGPSGGTSRVYRGGSWANRPVSCRSASRNGNSPSLRQSDLGFRVARDR